MHKLVFVLLEPQWILNTEAVNYQFRYPALFGLARCSNPESDTFHLVWRSNAAAEVLLLKCLIKMRFVLPRRNTTVLILLDCTHCCSAPLALYHAGQGPEHLKTNLLTSHSLNLSPAWHAGTATQHCPAHSATTHSTSYLCPSLSTAQCWWGGPQILRE